MEHLGQMENSLRESINQIHLHKENFGKHQLMSLEFADQDRMHLALMMNDVHENQPLSWLPNNDNQQMLVANEPNFLPQRDMGCSEDAPFPGYSGFLGTGKEIEVGNSGQADTTEHGGGSLNDLSTTVCLSLQLREQFSYTPYSSLNLPDDRKLKPDDEMSLQGYPAVYQVNGNFELSRPMFRNGPHDWVSASGPCGIAMFDEDSYHQQPN